MVIWVTVLLILLVVGYYLVMKFRDPSGDDRLTSNQLLTNFREMNEQVRPVFGFNKPITFAFVKPIYFTY